VDRTFRDPPGFHLDTDAVPQGADLVFVCNPNNPTGSLDPAGSLERLVSPGRLLVVDEAFMEFTVDEQESLASRADLPSTVVVRSITKLWGIPGLRAGYLLAPPDVVSLLKRVRQPWPVNSLALAALKATAEDEGTARKIAEQIAEARASLAEGLAELDGVRTWPSHANFVLIEVPDGAALADRLACRGIAVRRADTFPGLSPNHLRIAVRRAEENRVLLRALREEIK
jgi:histidinol-phosphate aminotransferase